VTGTGSVTKYYYAGTQRIAMRKDGILSFLLGDHLGSTSLVTDANGQNPIETRYKAWGEVRYTTPNTTLPTNYTYTGQYSYTGEFGLMFYNARWYDSSLGRFAQADTIIPSGVQGYDRYAYVYNNPILVNDPTGHLPPLPCFVCVATELVRDVVKEVVNAVTGNAPDNAGLKIASQFMSPKENDALNTYTAAGIARQSEVPDFGLYSNEWTSGRGIAQLSNAELQTPYGDKAANSGVYGLGVPGPNNLDPLLPNVAIDYMRKRIELSTNKCANNKCSVTDIFIVAGLAQTGTSFTKQNMAELLGGHIYGPQTFDPVNPNAATLPWQSFFSQNKYINTVLPLRGFVRDVKVLQSQGWHVPDVDWKFINGLAQIPY